MRKSIGVNTTIARAQIVMSLLDCPQLIVYENDYPAGVIRFEEIKSAIDSFRGGKGLPLVVGTFMLAPIGLYTLEDCPNGLEEAAAPNIFVVEDWKALVLWDGEVVNQVISRSEAIEVNRNKKMLRGNN